MRCHICTHHEAVLRGDYSSKPWNEIPCASCELHEDTFYSVPFDEENPPVSAPGCPVLPCDNDPVVPQHPSSVPLVAELPVEVLAKFIEGLLSLPAELRDIVAWRYQAITYKEIAERQGISTQLAEMRHKRALREFPMLQCLFTEKVAKRHRRISK